MRKTFTLWAAIGSLFAGSVFAQAPTHRTCGTLEAIAELQKADPAFKTRMDQNEVAISRYLSNPANRNRITATKTIPVVFHVVYANSTQNISTAAIQSQLDILNRDFRRMNSDTTATPTVFQGLGADTGIEFCLASVDPNGLPTTGITRTATTVSAFPVNSTVKANATGGKDPWPRDQYLNIWICNITSGILGFATPPGGPASSDGVVLLYTSVGAPPYNNFGGAYNKGRTATHEVGHWLNLKHIWGDEPACAADDLVTDTPMQKAENYGCPSYPQGTSASGGVCSGNGPSSMYMNYMDYTDDACMYMFTKGQRDRMIAAINTSRPTLAASLGCQNTLTANFTSNTTTVVAGGNINFTSTSVGNPTTYAWTFQGGTPATSSAQNPTGIVYSTPGTYTVTLTVTSASGSHTKTVPAYITVFNPSSCIDTLNRPFPGQATLYVSSSAGVKNGYVSGNNGFGDKAKAEYFANTGGANQVTGGIFSFGIAKAANASSAVTVTLWDNSGTGGKPGTVLATKTLPISTIIANIAANSLTSVTFTNPVAVTGPFYLGVQLSNTAGDTVALVTNRHNDSPAGRGWEQASNNAWDSYSTSWGLNISNAIFPMVNATPPVVNFTSSVTSTCAGTSVTFNAGTTGATSYSWSFPGGTPSNSTAANPTVTYNTAGSYNVALTASTTACNLTTTVNRPNAMTVTSAPTISISPAAQQICTPTPTTLTASGATSYTWSPATGLSSTTGSTVIANPAVTTVYTVTGNTNGCTSTNQVIITVSNVTADFTVTPNFINLANTSGQVTFTNTSTNATFYNWNFGDPSAGATLNTSVLRNPPAFTYTSPGVYTVNLTTSVSSGCNAVKTATVTVVNTTGLEEAYEKGTLRIYPNPAQHYLQVEVPERENVTEISLTNAIGQKIASQQPVAGSARLKVNNLPAGIYFVKISNAKGSITKKVSVIP